MARNDSGDRFVEVEGLYEEYTVYDMHYEKIGEVDDVFLDEDDRPEYIGVKMGFLGLRKTLIPWEMVRVNEKRHLMEVSESKDRVKDAPTFDDDEEITPELEELVYGYFGLQRADGPERGAYGAYYRDEGESPSPGSGKVGSASRPSVEHEREDGRPTFRKRARTERRPGERGETPSVAGTDEDTVVVPRIEEEVVIRKRLVVKEKIRIRKHVVEEEEIIEVPVRKEEVRIEDETRRGEA